MSKCKNCTKKPEEPKHPQAKMNQYKLAQIIFQEMMAAPIGGHIDLKDTKRTVRVDPVERNVIKWKTDDVYGEKKFKITVEEIK